MVRQLFTLMICFFSLTLAAQLTNNGATIVVEAGATLYVEGNLDNLGTGVITNNGILEVQGNLNHNGMTFNNTPGSKLVFSGPGASMVSLNSKAMNVDSMIVNKGAGIMVSLAANSDFTVNNGLRFASNSYVDLNSSSLSLGSGAGITGAANDRFVITDGTGELVKNSLAATPFTFPVGETTSEYNPITITNNGTADNIGVNTRTNVHETADNEGTAIVPDAISNTWVVSEAAAGGSDDLLDVTVEWAAADEPGAYNAAKSGVSTWNGSYWDLTIDDGIGIVGMTATRTGVSPGNIAVGGTGVMDFLLVSPKIFLSGPYNGANMNADITGMLPSGEPFGAMTSFTHSGIGGGETFTSAVGDVDWVFLEVREANSPYAIKGTCSAILRSDGTIVNPDASLMKLFGMASGQNFNLVIRHRNHLGIMTQLPFASSRSVATNLDFSNGTTLAFGTDPIQIIGSAYAMYGGDLTSDNIIDSDDLNSAWANKLTSGYLQNDATLDGNVDSDELTITWANRIKSSKVPNN